MQSPAHAVVESFHAAVRSPLSYSPQMIRGGSGSLIIVALLTTLVAFASSAQAQAKPSGTEPTPEPAIPAILSAFDKYEVVGMMEDHGDKDEDAFILSLIRNPEFPSKVNDIVVECGNSLYQPVLDRYIAGEDVPFTEVQKVWRDTPVTMCSFSGFFEEFFPLVRTINQKLPPDKRLRVLAGDPPVDWAQMDRQKLDGYNRNANIASVMEKEVLSKHRRALMLFGISHLFHGGGADYGGNAVAIYEKDYPARTFVIGGLGPLDLKASGSALKAIQKWPYPSLTRLTGTWLGAMGVTHFIIPNVGPDKDCNPQFVYPVDDKAPIRKVVDAILYLGPGDLTLAERVPADIVLDAPFMAEMFRRDTLTGGTNAKSIQEYVQQHLGDGSASQPVIGIEQTSLTDAGPRESGKRACAKNKRPFLSKPGAMQRP